MLNNDDHSSSHPVISNVNTICVHLGSWGMTFLMSHCKPDARTSKKSNVQSGPHNIVQIEG